MSRTGAIVLGLVAALLGWLLVTCLGHVRCAEAVRLAWDAVITDEDGGLLGEPVGYLVHQGVVSGHYDTQLDVGPAIQAVLTGLTPGQVYVFAVTCYLISDPGVVSQYSNEVSWTEPLPPPPVPPQIRISTPTDGQAVSRKTTMPVEVVQEAGGALDRVELYVDNTLLCIHSTAPYRCGWPVPAANNRTYRLWARALDAAGKVALAPQIEVTAR